MLGGYETTATALAYLSLILATHPKEQARLQNEIDHVYDDYEQLIKLEYLDWFIRETLRLYPIAPFIVNRECNKECQIGQFKIEVGTNIAVDMYSIHYNEQLYGPVSPLKFYPERFREKRHPLAWLPFGAGPRNCVGMRFAMLEIKLALVQILRRYTILSGENTLSQFEEHERFVIGPKNGIWVRLQRRDSHM
jgi:cytochrome P450